MNELTVNELCYMAYSYHDIGYFPKMLAGEIESGCKKALIEKGEDMKLEEIALLVKVFCKTRSASRDFHKLLETTILMRIGDLKDNLKVLHSIGRSFEESGLCSIDTLKALKKQASQEELNQEVFD